MIPTGSMLEEVLVHPGGLERVETPGHRRAQPVHHTAHQQVAEGDQAHLALERAGRVAGEGHGLVAVPLLAVAAGGASPPCGAGGPLEVEDDGTPSILGPSTLTVADLRAWWDAGGRGQPHRLGVDIADLIALYLSEGDA